MPYLGALADDVGAHHLPRFGRAGSGGARRLRADDRRPPRGAVRPRRAEGPDRRAACRSGPRPRPSRRSPATPRTPRRRRRSSAPRPGLEGRDPASRRRLGERDGGASRPDLGWRDAARRSSCSSRSSSLLGLPARSRTRRHRRSRPPTVGSARGSTCSTTPRARSRQASPPPVTPESVDDMAALGVRTLYLQVVNPDGAAADRAHRRRRCWASSSRARTTPGLEVVAWYLPTVVDVDADYTMIKPIAAFRAGGEALRRRRPRPRGHAERSRRRRPERPHRRSHEADAQAPRRRPGARGDRLPGGADRGDQPGRSGPTSRTAGWSRSVDVWMPMAYFTFRDVESGYRDPLRYTEDSVTLLRAHLRDKTRAGARDRRHRRPRHTRGLRRVPRGGARARKRSATRCTTSARRRRPRGRCSVPAARSVRRQARYVVRGALAANSTIALDGRSPGWRRVRRLSSVAPDAPLDQRPWRRCCVSAVRSECSTELRRLHTSRRSY